MCIIAFFLQKNVLPFEIPQWRVFLSTPVAPNERNVACLEKGMGRGLCDAYSGIESLFWLDHAVEGKGFFKWTEAQLRRCRTDVSCLAVTTIIARNVERREFHFMEFHIRVRITRLPSGEESNGLTSCPWNGPNSSLWNIPRSVTSI